MYITRVQEVRKHSYPVLKMQAKHQQLSAFDVSCQLQSNQRNHDNKNAVLVNILESPVCWPIFSSKSTRAN